MHGVNIADLSNWLNPALIYAHTKPIETTYYIYNRRTPLSMASPAGTITPVSSLCGSETPTALSPGFEGGFIPISPSGDGGFLSSRTTPAVINDHIRWQHPDTPQTHYFTCLVILCHILLHSQQLGTKYFFAFLKYGLL